MPKKKRRTNPPSKCPVCYAPVNKVPAGVSKKTGKRYSAFWACKNPECDFTWNSPGKKKGSSGGSKTSQGNVNRNAMKKAFKAIQNDIRKVDKKVDKMRKDLDELTDFLKGDQKQESEDEIEPDEIPF